MAHSQNGLSANDRSLIASFLIPGSTRKIALRKGWVSVLLLDFLGFWHNEIEPIDQGVLDDWGYAERLVRGSATDVSNHASGSAADANALRHVLGKLASASLAQWQIDRIRARIALYRRALRWGGDYSGRKDVMHVEVDDPTNGPAVAAQIQTGWLAPGVRSYLTGAATAAPGPAPEEDDDMPMYMGYRSDPLQREDDGRTGDGTMVLAAPGVWDRIETGALSKLYQDMGMVKEYKNIRPDEFRELERKFLKAAPRPAS